MQFYKILGYLTSDEKDSMETVADRESGEEIPFGNPRHSRRNAHRIAQDSAIFNRNIEKDSFIFLADLTEESVTIGSICLGQQDMKQLLAEYCEVIHLQIEDISIDEITFAMLQDLLSTADYGGYIRDSDEVLQKFGLHVIEGFMHRNRFEEDIVACKSREAIYAEAKTLMAANSMLPELDRIYQGKWVPGAFGFPVHYFVEADDEMQQKGMACNLIRALLANNRIRNHRYCFLEMEAGDRINKEGIRALYQSCENGTMVIRYQASDDSENDYAAAGRETIRILCEMMHAFKNRTQTIFCLARECTAEKNIFLEYLPNIGMIEIREDIFDTEAAKQYLSELAAGQQLEPDEQLFSRLNREDSYLTADLRKHFDEWFTEKLKTAVYPQYNMVAFGKEIVREKKPKGDPYQELMEMVGLAEAKKIIHQALDFNKARKLFADRGMKAERPSMHMVFSGNPGTAKTTVARLFAGIMRDNELLSTGKLIEVGRGDLVGKFVGWTAPIIKQRFREARGSVLFIDEAYALVDDRNGSFGDEAINTIVQEMENHRDDVVVIFAGYPDKMEEFLQKNPGLRSRIAFHVPFEDYSEAELTEIARIIAGKQGLTLTDEAVGKLEGIFHRVVGSNDFGNGRYVRNILERAKMAQASRLVRMDLKDVGQEDICRILPEDIEEPLLGSKQEEKPRIGFCA